MCAKGELKINKKGQNAFVDYNLRQINLNIKRESCQDVCPVARSALFTTRINPWKKELDLAYVAEVRW